MYVYIVQYVCMYVSHNLYDDLRTFIAFSTTYYEGIKVYTVIYMYIAFLIIKQATRAENMC